MKPKPLSKCRIKHIYFVNAPHYGIRIPDLNLAVKGYSDELVDFLIKNTSLTKAQIMLVLDIRDKWFKVEEHENASKE